MQLEESKMQDREKMRTYFGDEQRNSCKHANKLNDNERG